ncbi:MAG: hypothetical protein AB7G11_14335 [Phycisphaerales bacterium]
MEAEAEAVIGIRTVEMGAAAVVGAIVPIEPVTIEAVTRSRTIETIPVVETASRGRANG